MTILSRFQPRFVRSLIYMLQASEYDVRDFLAWYTRTSDFAHVEKRKQIVWTTKAKMLYALTWLFVILWLAMIGWVVARQESDLVLLLGALIALATPYLLPYALVCLTLFVRLAQKPLEESRIRIAEAKLLAHPGLKIAIAGSYGKTTMREILKTVLSASKKVAAPPGSYNTPLGIASFVNTLDGDEDFIIFELGEYYPGDITKLCKIVHPNIGVITGVNEAHLQKFGTLEKTAATIFELADELDERPLYINAENDLARSRARAADTLFSREAVGEWRIAGAQSDLRGTTFRMVRGSEIIRASSKLLGLHMVGPLAAAAALAVELEIPVVDIEEGLKATKAFDHRLQMTIDNTGVITLDDSYNGNPDGVAAVISFLAGLVGHKRYYVTPGLVEMGSRLDTVHRDIGRQLAEAKIEIVVLIKNSVTPFIEMGLKERGYGGKVMLYDDMPTALIALQHLTVSGDIVLIQNDWPDQYS